MGVSVRYRCILNRKNLFAFAVLSWFCSVQTNAQQLAFPGAEGFGRFAQGGRGGKVFIVTDLNDNGPGSFREACEAKGPRTVVFAVSGIIDLASPLNVTEPYLTIAGQTAPGEGICLKRSEFEVRTHDVVVRFLRSRPGDISGKEMDAMGIGRDAHDVIFDHCSANWSVDECLSPSGGISNVTVQWCLIGEALNKSVHHKGAHGFGSLVRAVGGVSLHHNLWLDNISRNPRLGDNYGKAPWPTFDFRNNVIYNWGDICSGMTGDHLSVNYVNNYLRPGPSSSKRAPIALTQTADVKYFITGNVIEGRSKSLSNPESYFSPSEIEGRKLFILMDKPFDVAPVTTTSAEEAYKLVLLKVGAIYPVRDAVDTRLINEVINNTGHIIDSQKEVGEWSVYPAARAAIDSDSDGIPDSWELSHQLNPKDSADGNGHHLDSVYTNLEVYLNSLVK